MSESEAAQCQHEEKTMLQNDNGHKKEEIDELRGYSDSESDPQGKKSEKNLVSNGILMKFWRRRRRRRPSSSSGISAQISTAAAFFGKVVT